MIKKLNINTIKKKIQKKKQYHIESIKKLDTLEFYINNNDSNNNNDNDLEMNINPNIVSDVPTNVEINHDNNNSDMNIDPNINMNNKHNNDTNERDTHESKSQSEIISNDSHNNDSNNSDINMDEPNNEHTPSTHNDLNDNYNNCDDLKSNSNTVIQNMSDNGNDNNNNEGKRRKGGKGGKRQTKSAKAGLIFPVARLKRYLKKGNYAQRVGGATPVYIAAVLEYLVAEILESAGNVTKDNKKLTIVPRHIQLAIKMDDELNSFFGNAIVSNGGVLPNIHAVLLPTNKNKTRKK